MSIEGIRNLSGPNITRQIAVQMRPVRAGMWSFVPSHCSVNDAMKSAVMEYSIPSVEKGSTAPSRFPIIVPLTQ